MTEDLYLDDLAEETGKLFENWAWDKMDVEEMATQYMNSHLRENIDKRYARFCTQDRNEMARQFPAVIGDKLYDPILCDWLGCFYTYLQNYTGISSRDLIKKYPFAVMYLKSNVLHDLDFDLAIKKVCGE